MIEPKRPSTSVLANAAVTAYDCVCVSICMCVTMCAGAFDSMCVCAPC